MFTAALLATSTWLHAQSTAGIYVSPSNNVGIGTTNPAVNLDVNPSSGPSFIQAKGTGTALILNHTTVNAGSSVNFRENGTDKFIIGTGVYAPDVANFDIGTNAASLFRISNAGNVGIGTTSPAGQLSNNSINYGELGSGGSVGSFNWLHTSNDAGWNAISSAGSNGLVVATDQTGGTTFQVSSGTYNAATCERANHLFTILGTGNVGIGTTSPTAALDINDNGVATVHQAVRIEGVLDAVRSGRSIDFYAGSANSGNAANPYARIAGITNSVGTLGELSFYTNNSLGASAPTEAMRINGFGYVGIGTTTPGYLLDVAGQVHASAFVAPSQTYADFVFKPGYKLAPLSDVEASIKNEGHLPGIPSEAEAKAHGIDLASMQVKLLQKIEEITLHQIEEEKQLKEQAQRIEQLEKENAKLRTTAESLTADGH